MLRVTSCGWRDSQHETRNAQLPANFRAMLRGLVVIILLLLNLLRWGTPVMLGGIIKFAVQMTAPKSRLRTRVILALASLAERWVAGNDRVFDRLLPTRWDVAGIGDDVEPSGHYLIISNHVSWVDIFVLFRAFH